MRRLYTPMDYLPMLCRLRGLDIHDRIDGAGLLVKAHDDFLLQTAYTDCYDADCNLIRTILEPVRNNRR